MSELLASYLARFLHDEAEFERSLNGPVLLYEPPDQLPESGDGEYQFKTLSLSGNLPPPGGEPVVLRIRKHKDNAFLRGITVGRTRNNDIVFDSPSISRFHAWFQEESEGRWTVADAGSKNGTVVAGNPLKPKKAAPLADESRIRFGEIEVRFLTPAALLRMLRSRG